MDWILVALLGLPVCISIIALANTHRLENDIVWLETDTMHRFNRIIAMNKRGKKSEYAWAFRVVGRECGRDSSGTFHCYCGQCSPFRVDIGHGGEYRGDDCGDGGYEGEKYIDRIPPLGTSGS